METINSIVSLFREAVDHAHEFLAQDFEPAIDNLCQRCVAEMSNTATLGTDASSKPFDSTNQLLLTNATPTQRQENCPDQGCRHDYRYLIDIPEYLVPKRPQELLPDRPNLGVMVIGIKTSGDLG